MEPLNENEKIKKTGAWYNCLRRTAVISLLLAVIVSILMLLVFFQTRTIDPLKIKEISTLQKQLAEDPQNSEIKDQIRALDLMSRKTFFISKWQIRVGAYLIFGFCLIFVLILKYLYSLSSRFPDLKKSLDLEQGWETRLKSRKKIAGTAVILFCLVIFLGFWSENRLSKIGNISKSSPENVVSLVVNKPVTTNWPGFRGPAGLGISAEKDSPVEWDGKTSKNILWKIPIPLQGYNSPIIWEDKLFLSGADRKEQAVYCISPESGKILWQTMIKDVPGSPEKAPRTSGDTGYAAATMTTEGKSVYVVFATGDVAALDFDGKVLWTRNLGVPDNHYGHSSSLILYQDLLLLQYDQNTGGHLVALKSDTGKIVYDTPRKVQISWASPILVNTGERDEVILNSNPFVISYNPRTGKELWKVNCMLGEVGPSLAYSDGLIFAVNEYARLAAITPGDQAKIVWEYDDGLSEVSSPLATNGILIMAASYGLVTCFDTKTGEKLWEQEYDEGFYASPILVGDKVYLTDMLGKTFVFKAEREFKLIAANSLGENVVSTPAFKNKRLYLRGYKNLFCIGE